MTLGAALIVRSLFVAAMLAGLTIPTLSPGPWETPGRPDQCAPAPSVRIGHACYLAQEATIPAYCLICGTGPLPYTSFVWEEVRYEVMVTGHCSTTEPGHLSLIAETAKGVSDRDGVSLTDRDFVLLLDGAVGAKLHRFAGDQDAVVLLLKLHQRPESD